VCRKRVEAVATCSRGCGAAHKELAAREADRTTKSGAKVKRLQLWEIQKTLGRGDFIEVRRNSYRYSAAYQSGMLNL
jgi:hypothetical protein